MPGLPYVIQETHQSTTRNKHTRATVSSENLKNSGRTDRRTDRLTVRVMTIPYGPMGAEGKNCPIKMFHYVIRIRCSVKFVYPVQLIGGRGVLSLS